MDENLAATLECPVCMEVPKSGPISQCDNGHLLCKDCRLRLTDCPICKTKLRINRSLVAEKILECLPVTCRYSTHGCKMKFVGASRSDHEAECPFREVQCPYLWCKKKYPLPVLFDHDPTHRFVPVSAQGKLVSNIKVREDHFDVNKCTYSYWIPYQIKFCHKLFFIIFKRDPKKKIWHLWVYFLGTAAEAKSFHYNVTIFTDGNRELSFTAPVSSIDLTEDEVIESGIASEFSFDVAKRFWKKSDAKIDFRAQIFISKPLGVEPKQDPVETRKCAFQKFGCLLELTEPELVEHQRACEFREVGCIDFYCKREVTVAKMIDHLQEAHGLPVGGFNSCKIGAYCLKEVHFQKSTKWQSSHIKFKGRDFISEFYRNNEMGLWYIWVYLIGTQSDADDFQFTVRIPSHGTQFQIFRNAVTPVDLKFDDVLLKGSVCCFTDFTARQMWDQAGEKITYGLKIECSSKAAQSPTSSTKRKVMGPKSVQMKKRLKEVESSSSDSSSESDSGIQK